MPTRTRRLEAIENLIYTYAISIPVLLTIYHITIPTIVSIFPRAGSICFFLTPSLELLHTPFLIECLVHIKAVPQ
jgi:hypothetical protein